MSVELVVNGLSGNVISVLESQGLPIRRKLDIDVPAFPRDITAVDDQELMMLARHYMENYNFIITQVACAELAIADLEGALERREAELLITLTTDKSKATVVKAMITTDSEVASMKKDLLVADAYHKLLKTMQDNLERYYQLTSRELTRRTSSMKSRF